MALTPEQQTALDALKGVDPTELADAFHASHGAAAQIINDRGHASATKGKAKEIRDLEKKLETELEAREKAEKKLSEADPAKVHQQYQDEIRTKDDQHKREVADFKARVKSERKERDLAELKSRLSTKLKPVALAMITTDRATEAQLDYDDDGNRTVKQRGKDIPYSPPAGKDVIDLWASDLVETVKAIDPDSVLVSANAGGGSGGGGGGGGSGKTKEQVIEEKRKSGVY
jgi:hypothetical protein